MKSSNITFDILMPRTKPITTGTIYRAGNQSKFLDIFDKVYLNSTQTILKFTP